MLRSITAAQFQELYAFSKLNLDSGEGRADIRFALMTADVVRTLGGKGLGGGRYTIADYLQALHASTVIESEEVEKVARQPVKETPKQSVKQMELYLDTWMKGSNQIRKERGRRK